MFHKKKMRKKSWLMYMIPVAAFVLGKAINRR